MFDRSHKQVRYLHNPTLTLERTCSIGTLTNEKTKRRIRSLTFPVMASTAADRSFMVMASEFGRDGTVENMGVLCI